MPIDVNAMGIDLLSLTGPQVLRPEGRRRAVHPPQEAADPAGLPDRRRRARAGPALRHPQRSRHRRPRPRGGDLPRGDGGGVGAARVAARSAARGPAARARRRSRQRLARTAPAAQPARQLRQGRGRIAADGARRSRGVDRVGLQLRQPGAVARPARRLAPSATMPAPRSGSASAARPPTRTSTSRSTASRTVVKSLRRAMAVS